MVEPTVFTLEFGETENPLAFIDGPASCPTDEQANRRGDPGDGAHSAGHFFDVDAGIGQGYRHGVVS